MNTIIFDESLRITYRGMEDFDLCVRRNFIFDNFKIIFPEVFKAKVEFIDGTYVGKATIIGLEPEDRRETHTFSWNFRDYKYTNDVRMLDVKEALSCDYENAKCYDFKMDGIEDYFQIDAECRIILSACDYIMNYKRDKIDKKAIGTEIIDAQTGETKKSAEATINAFVDTVTKSLKKGDKVQLVGFGSFEVRKRAARKGRNPQTKEEIKIPASKAPVFKAGKALKDLVNKK